MKRGRNFAPEFETDIIFRQYISWTSNYSDSLSHEFSYDILRFIKFPARFVLSIIANPAVYASL